MYNKEDAINVILKVKELIKKQANIASPKKNLVIGRILYQDFVKVLLEFQLLSHEKFLKPFVLLFKKHDIDSNGVLNQKEFVDLVVELNSSRTLEELSDMLKNVDKHNNDCISFSEVWLHFYSCNLGSVSLFCQQSYFD